MSTLNKTCRSSFMAQEVRGSGIVTVRVCRHSIIMHKLCKVFKVYF